MKTKAVILAGGEGSRLGILTAKRTKPAVPFAGKYRIIDFTLSNCVNSGIFDVMILAQYRPHSLIEHIGAGGPWDLNRDFTGGVRMYTPFKGRGASDWYLGTADAVQQNFRFIKNGSPDIVLILSGDHIYEMNYAEMIAFHQAHTADLTMATIPVTLEDASRFGIVELDIVHESRVARFIEKPQNPRSNLANMGVYVFNLPVLDRLLWEDYKQENSTHDFGKDIIPRMIAEGARVYAYPYTRYWVDVGTVDSYWQAHMDLLAEPPSIDLNNRAWVIHTRTEERPPVRIAQSAVITDSMISDGCVIAAGSHIERSILSPGVRIESNTHVHDSIILTNAVIEANAVVERAIIDKKVHLGANTHVGFHKDETKPVITMIGKNSQIPPHLRIEAGAVIDTDVIPDDINTKIVRGDEYIQTKRLANEV